MKISLNSLKIGVNVTRVYFLANRNVLSQPVILLAVSHHLLDPIYIYFLPQQHLLDFLRIRALIFFLNDWLKSTKVVTLYLDLRH